MKDYSLDRWKEFPDVHPGCEWELDEVTAHNKGEFLLTYGGRDGVYIHSFPSGEAEIGFFEGAIQFITDATFRKVFGRKCASNAEDALIHVATKMGLDIEFYDDDEPEPELGVARVVNGVLICPKGHEMVLRNGRYGKFYGCTAFRTLNCEETVDYAVAQRLFEEAKNGNKPPKEFVPSARQQAIFDHVTDPNNGNLVVRADAGSGKTRTGLEVLKLLPADQDIVFCCFNKSIQRELADKVPAHVPARTLHSLGRSAVLAYVGYEPELDGNKVWNIIKEVLPDPADHPLRAPLKKLVSMARATLTDPTDLVALEHMAAHYRIELNGDAERLLPLVAGIIKACLERKHIIDYDDMVHMPVALNLPVQQYDIVVVDECQDLNACQIGLVLKMVRPGGKVIAIGDEKQSIYGFRGADTQAIPRLIEALEADTLPLDISYRNPKSHIAFVREQLPHVTTEPAPWAEEGTIHDLPYNKLMQEAADDDLILCRVNAPLVKACYSFIRAGRKAVIRGRDIGKSLQAFIDKLKPVDVNDLLAKLTTYKWEEAAKLEAAGKDDQIEALYDRCDTLEALTDGCRDLSELRNNIDRVFNDLAKTGIILSSVHRAKGSEAERVFILKPDLMPHPMAKADWQIEQEKNVMYVAYTRSKREMVFVRGG